MKPKKEDADIDILTGRYVILDGLVPERRTELDLGCGKGGFTVELARRHPDSAVLAADVMIGRLRKLTGKIRAAGLSNVRLLRTEARALVCVSLPHGSIDRAHILCPDPWPKHRHKGERLMSSEFIYRLSLVLKKGGVLHFSTDDTRYFDATSALVDSSGLFARDPDAISDVADIKTDFEKRWNSQGLKVGHAAWRKA
jgi:tRNA (guanine-N7-)-methyltransferase